MTHASNATAALRDAVAAPVAGVAAAVRQAIAAQEALREADDLLPVMEATVGLILAMEALQERAEATAKQGRTKLAETMAGTGATTIRTDAHTVSVKDGSRRPVLTGPVPPELMVPQPDKPDMDEIGRRLKAGERLGFAELSNGGAPVLQIRNRQQKAA